MLYLALVRLEDRNNVMINNIKGRQLLYAQSEQEFVNLTVHFIIIGTQQHRVQAVHILL
jgi:hypothetical protein